MDGNNLTILLVDDDNIERSGVRFLIDRGKMPLDILEAPNGRKALDIIRERKIDILFTDVKMPYMDGLELSAIVYKEFPQIKIIIFSAYGEFEYAKKAMAAKAINYLLKPIDVAEFASVMDTVVSRCREEEALAKQKQRRMLADKKLQWINLLTGKQTVDPSLLDELKEQGYPTQGNVTLLHMEAQGDTFAVREKALLSCLQENLSCQYEYINLYPNSSYLIAFQEISREEISDLCEKIAKSTAEGEILFLADDLYFTLDFLAERVKKANDITRQMFILDSGVLFMSDLTQLMKSGFSEVEAVWNETSKAILSRNKTIILIHINELLDTMSGNGLFSKTYIHHIFCDLFGKLYTEYGYDNVHRMQDVIHQLSSCNNKKSLMLLCSAVLDEVNQRKTDEQDVSHVVQKVKRMVREQYSEDLSLDYLGQSVGLAPSYLSYVFKRETGENLIKYLTDYRMCKAKEMLDEGNLKIVQVAKLCGYENQSYFNRLFKNTYGLTPSQYKEKANGQ